MDKKTLKIITIISTIVLVICTSTFVFALTPIELKGNEDNNTTNGISNVGNRIIGVISPIGIVVSVIILMVIGIKYMVGSAEEKSKYK